VTKKRQVTQKTQEHVIVRCLGLICGTAIVITALLCGYDSTLAFLSIIALWGGEKVLKKAFLRKNLYQKRDE